MIALFSLSIASTLSIALLLVTGYSTPLQAEVSGVQINGTGCPPETTTFTETDLDGDGLADFWQILYSDFSMERPGRFHQNCHINFRVRLPGPYQLRLARLQSRGFAELHRSHLADFSGQFQVSTGGRPATTNQELAGPYAEPFVLDSTIERSGWSSCRRQIAVNAIMQMRIRGKPGSPQEAGASSTIQVERTSGLFVQQVALEWRSCSG
jgi:hypothetical protein